MELTPISCLGTLEVSFKTLFLEWSSGVCAHRCVTVVHGRLQEVSVQQLIHRQLPDQVEAAEVVQHRIQVRGGGATLRKQHRHLHS